MMSHTHFHHMCSVSFSKHFFTRFSKTRRTIRRRTRGRRRSRKRRIRKNAICTFVYTHWVNATYDFQIRSPRKESVGKRSEQLLSPLCRELNKDIHILVWTFQHPRPICIWQCGTKFDMQKRLMANLENEEWVDQMYRGYTEVENRAEEDEAARERRSDSSFRDFRTSKSNFRTTFKKAFRAKANSICQHQNKGFPYRGFQQIIFNIS